MARCPDCNKFVSYDDGLEPEADLDVDDEGHVTGSVRVILACAECGTELREALFDVDIDFSTEVKEHRAEFKAEVKAEAPEADGDEHDFEVDADVELTSRTEGRGRGLRTWYGFQANVRLVCSCDETNEASHEIFSEVSDEIQASQMDEVC